MPSEPVAITESDNSNLEQPDTMPEPDILPRQYSLRERKPVNYRE